MHKCKMKYVSTIIIFIIITAIMVYFNETVIVVLNKR